MNIYLFIFVSPDWDFWGLGLFVCLFLSCKVEHLELGSSSCLQWNGVARVPGGRLATWEHRVIAPDSHFPCLVPICSAAPRHCSLKEAGVLSHHGPKHSQTWPIFCSRLVVCSPVEGLGSALWEDASWGFLNCDASDLTEMLWTTILILKAYA